MKRKNWSILIFVLILVVLFIVLFMTFPELKLQILNILNTEQGPGPADIGRGFR